MRILAIYKEIKGLCEKHHITYYSIGGTTLGAIRHKGFIPWDDDLDMAVKIGDFERFVSVCKSELPEWLEVFIPGETKHCGWPYIKIMDNRTMLTCSQEMQYPDCYTGVFVDIMILHGMPKSYKAMAQYIKRWGYLVRGQAAVKSKLSLKAPLPHVVLWFLMRPYAWFKPADYMWKKFLTFLKQYQVEGERYVSDTGGMFIFPQAWFGKTETIPFEDTTICVPVGWDGYLRMVYGEYKQMPPEEKRHGGHLDKGGVLDLEHSYKEYASGKMG